MEPENSNTPSTASSWMAALQRHPIIATLMVVLTALGAVAGVLYMDPSYTLMHRIIGGAVAGAGCGLMIAAPRMVGP